TEAAHETAGDAGGVAGDGLCVGVVYPHGVEPGGKLTTVQLQTAVGADLGIERHRAHHRRVQREDVELGDGCPGDACERVIGHEADAARTRVVNPVVLPFPIYLEEAVVTGQFQGRGVEATALG